MLVAERPQDAGGVVDEAAVVQGAQDALRQVRAAAQPVLDLPERLLAQVRRHGVDGEVAPG